MLESEEKDDSVGGLGTPARPKWGKLQKKAEKGRWTLSRGWTSNLPNEAGTAQLISSLQVTLPTPTEQYRARVGVNVTADWKWNKKVCETEKKYKREKDRWPILQGVRAALLQLFKGQHREKRLVWGMPGVYGTLSKTKGHFDPPAGSGTPSPRWGSWRWVQVT